MKNNIISSMFIGLGTFLFFAGVVAFKLFTEWQIGALALLIAIVLLWLGGLYETRKKLR